MARYEIPFKHRGEQWVAQASPARMTAGARPPDPGSLEGPFWWLVPVNEGESIQGPAFSDWAMQDLAGLIEQFRLAIDQAGA